MSEKWDIGDLAQCIAGNGGEWFDARDKSPTKGPPTGSIHRVSGVTVSDDHLCLRFDEFPGEDYVASYFVKVQPPRKAKAVTREEELTE